MDRKTLEKLIGQEVAVARYRPRKGMPFADKATLKVVGVAQLTRFMPEERANVPGAGPFILIQHENGEVSRVQSRQVVSTWADYEIARAEEARRKIEQAERRLTERADQNAFAQRAQTAAAALGLADTSWDVRCEPSGWGEGYKYRVSFEKGNELIALLESLVATGSPADVQAQGATPITKQASR